MSLAFGILDTLGILEGQSSREALKDSLELSVLAEQLGYSRYWIGESHDGSAAASAPEIVVCAVASRTQRLRVGAAGILLNHYSSLKVAEWFAALSALYPNRIDLGIGRTLGSSEQTAQALRAGMADANLDYTEKLQKLLSLIDERSIDVEVWLLGHGTRNSELASHFGTSFAFGRPDADSVVLERYRTEFKASNRQSSPHDLLAVMALCSETAREAEDIFWGSYRQMVKANGPTTHVPAYLSPTIQAFANKGSTATLYPQVVVGDPPTVRKQLEALGEFFGVREFVLGSIPLLDFRTRLRSYELIAKVFNLNGSVNPGWPGYNDGQENVALADLP